MTLPAGSPKLEFNVGYLKGRPWRLQIFIDDDDVKTQVLGQGETVDRKDVPPNAAYAAPSWATVRADLSKYAGKKVRLRLYHWLVPDAIPGAAYWRSVQVE